MQGYTVLYCREGEFIIFIKRNRGYFFSGPPGVMVPAGQLLNGRQLPAFPGGAVAADETAFEGCTREFIEECGSQVFFSYALGHENEIAGLDKLEVNGSQYDILSAEINTVDGLYHTLYLEFAHDDLFQILTLISDTNLEESASAAYEVREGDFGNYESIFNIYPFAPRDNELDTGNIWNINDGRIAALEHNQSTDWYYFMIQYLIEHIL